MTRASVLFATIGLGVTSCDTLNRPITTGDFDPLRPPGSNNAPTVPVAPMFKAGQFVRAAINNTAFFKNRPKGEGDADKLLPRGTSMKVISLTDSFVKVELDSGEIGFVPAVMLEDPSAAAAMPQVNPGEYQVYPPLGGYGEPLPVVPSGEVPPEGAIPTVIDPEAPAPTTPVPPVQPPTGTFPAPATPPAEAPIAPPQSTPLPPNDEELEAQKKAAEAPPAGGGSPAEATPKLEQE